MHERGYLMPGPIVFISQFRIRQGSAAAFAEAFARAVELIAGSKAGTAVFQAYVDAQGSDLRIVHVFTDAAAMASHFEGAAERASAIEGLVEPTGFEVFGPAPASAIDRLRGEASASGAGMRLYPQSVGGFLRGPA